MKESFLTNFIAPPEYAPQARCSHKILTLLLLTAAALALVCEALYLPTGKAAGELELNAALTMQKAAAELHILRQELGIPLDPAVDPNASGLIGLDYSDLTTTQGSLAAKRTSCNPAFAGILVRLLREAGVKEGDRVAVSLTGSFPAMNLAVLSACSAMKLKPYIISSVGASTFGANIPGFSWLDMEKRLYDRGVFPFLSMAVSLGGVVETGGGIDGTGLEIGAEAVKKHGSPFLEEGDWHDVERSTLARKALFDRDGPPACYVNVGGGLTALGWVPESVRLDNGLLQDVPIVRDPARGLIFRYAEEGVPVIHLLNIERLARRYALPVDPVPMPPPGEALHTRAYLKRYAVLVFILLAWTGAACYRLRQEGGGIEG